MTNHIELIREALAYDPRPDVTLENVVEWIMEGRLTPWLGKNSIAVTEDGPGGRLHVSIAAGDMGELMNDIFPQVLAYKEKNGYKVLSGYGREGWLRALKDKGVTPLGFYFEFGGVS